jgi:hypothetical protein
LSFRREVNLSPHHLYPFKGRIIQYSYLRISGSSAAITFRGGLESIDERHITISMEKSSFFHKSGV